MIKLQLLPTPSPFSLGSVNAVSQVSATLTYVFHLIPLQNLETVTSRNLTLTISSPFSYSLPPSSPSPPPHQLLKPVGLRCLSSSSWLLLQASMLRYLKMWYLPLEQICAGGICSGLLSSEMLWRCRRWR